MMTSQTTAVAAHRTMGAGRLIDAAVLLAIVATGAARLPTPLGGDQALNLLMGQVIYEGGAPYRDLWDLKHPGIFVFFAAGGALFGFDAIGIHLLELIWMCALAMIVRLLARQWLGDGTPARLSPALVVAVYFAMAGERYLSQTEALVGLPLLASLACTGMGLARGRINRGWLVAAGVSAGVVTVFKIPYLAIPLTFWLLALRGLRQQSQLPLRTLIARAAPWLVTGALLPVLATILYLVRTGVAADAFWTFFRHPAEVGEAVALEPRRLAYAIRTFLLTFAPLVALAGLGLLRTVRGRHADLVTLSLWSWLGVGALLIAVQITSWWDYHFLLLLVPLGLLAASGLQAVGERIRTPLAATLAVMVLAALFAPQISAVTRVTTAVWWRSPPAFLRIGVAPYLAEHHPHHALVRSRTTFLQDGQAEAGPIYVVDAPTYYVHAGRRPAIPLLAPWFHPTDRLWQRLLDDLAGSLPPYVRVADWAVEAILDARPDLASGVERLMATIDAHYEMLCRDADGAWYVRRDVSAAGQMAATRAIPPSTSREVVR